MRQRLRNNLGYAQRPKRAESICQRTSEFRASAPSFPESRRIIAWRQRLCQTIREDLNNRSERSCARRGARLIRRTKSRVEHPPGGQARSSESEGTTAGSATQKARDTPALVILVIILVVILIILIIVVLVLVAIVIIIIVFMVFFAFFALRWHLLAQLRLLDRIDRRLDLR